MCSTLLTVSAGAGVYTWTDAQGQVHYADKPTHTAAEELQMTASPLPTPPQPSEDARRKTQRRLLEIYQEERQQKQAAAKKLHEDKAAKQENCRKARLRHEHYNKASGIYQKNAQGERHYLDRAARDQYMRDLQTDMERWCGRD
jgi:hypothetical protein